MRTAIQRLGSTPTPGQVMQYMHALGLQHRVIGSSILGRDLVVYEFPQQRRDKKRQQEQAPSRKEQQQQQKEDDDDRNVPTVLFLSLVHGNEPMGLISLLTTAHILAEGSSRLRRRLPAVRLLFFPVVNIDGYLRNLQCAAGRHRGNMRITSCENRAAGYLCPNEQQNNNVESTVGVDLNRNFPLDWNGTYSTGTSDDACSTNYHGTAPFSEPETAAIRQIVQENHVVAALSFHSLSSKFRDKPLLIHPFTSARPLTNAAHAAKFQSWGRALNANGLYKVGTAAETIDYTAGGTTIDFLYGVNNVTAFVLEVVPVCEHRWCPATPRLYRTARDYGNVGRRLVELVVHGKVVQDVDSIQRSVGFLLFLLFLYMLWTRKMPLVTLLRRRVYGKFKDVSLNEAEMQNLSK